MAQLKPLIAGNWKMNGLRTSLKELDAMIAGSIEVRNSVDMLVCPPLTLLHEAVGIAGKSGVMIGAQDCHSADKGAHTGDVSAEMIADVGAGWVIVGHSERRTDHGESNQTVRGKAEAALRAGLAPIVCIGETESERKAGTTLDVLGTQLEGSLPDSSQITIAYEPVWAIGTGLTPTPQDIAEVHAFLRSRIVAKYGRAGNSVRLLYGGSVKPGNASELMGVGDVNGALVGGASLKSDDFLGICRACL